MAKTTTNPGSWSEYERLVLDKLDDHTGKLAALDEKVQSTKDVLEGRIQGGRDLINAKIDQDVGRLEEKLNNFRTDIAILQVKAGVWGILGGGLTVAISLAVTYLSKH